MLLTFVFSVAFTPAFAAPPGPPPLDTTLDELALDAPTRAAVDELLLEARPELDALHDALRDREEQLLDDVRSRLSEADRARLDAALPPPPPARDEAPPAR